MSEMEAEWKRQRDEWLTGQPRDVVAVAYVWFKSGWIAAQKRGPEPHFSGEATS